MSCFWNRLVLAMLGCSLGFGLAWKKLQIHFLLWLAAITGLIAYHAGMRILVSNTWNSVLHNHADYRRAWFHVRPEEYHLYQKLQVRRWKNKMPTHDPESFNVKTHTWDEIAQTTCQSELVHETNFALSLVPVFFVPAGGVRWFTAAAGVTGMLADSIFIIMQRFNRGRIVKMIDREKRASRKNLKASQQV